MLGVGVMISELSDNSESVEAVKAAIGKTIKSIALKDNKVGLVFSDDSGVVIWDDGQSCCEERYITTDDKLEDYVGAELKSAEVRDAPNVTDGDEYDEHEVQFLVLETSKGNITFETHNIHNGYYGGFYIKAEKM